MRLAAVAAVTGAALLVGPSHANASAGSLKSQWRDAARVTKNTSEYQTFCVKHRGNDHYWRDGFCRGDLENYPDYGKLSVPAGYHVCYVRDSVRAGETARIALSHRVHPARHLRGC